MSSGEARLPRFGRHDQQFDVVDLVGSVEGWWEPFSMGRGEHLFDEGDPSDSLYVVVEGELRLEVMTEDVDTDAVLGFVGPGSLLGELGLITGSPRSATAVAVDDVRLHRLTASALEDLCEREPERGLAVYRLLARAVSDRVRRGDAQAAASLFATADDPIVNRVLEAAEAAQARFVTWSEDRVDALLADVAGVIADAADDLGRATVDETSIGIAADKAQKIRFASLGVLGSLQNRNGHGELQHHERERVTDLGAPVGVLFAVTPVTEPVSTYVNKVLLALKGRNAIVVSPHRGSVAVARRAHDLVTAVLGDHGAPDGLVQLVVERASRQRTARFLSDPRVGLILATGGSDLVRAAYRSGRPAIGVGPGNAPVWISATADLAQAASCIVASKTFDNGLICGAEQHIVVDASVWDPFLDKFRAAGAAVLTEEQAAALKAKAFNKRGQLTLRYVGRTAAEIASAAGLDLPDGATVVSFIDDPAEPSLPGRTERLAPIVTLYRVDDLTAGSALARRLLDHEGKGHTAVIHSEDEDEVLRFAEEMPVSRILVNVPSSHGCGGALTGLVPSTTLGCGTYGGNSTTDNVGLINVLNVKRVARPYLGNLLPVRRLARKA